MMSKTLINLLIIAIIIGSMVHEGESIGLLGKGLLGKGLLAKALLAKPFLFRKSVVISNQVSHSTKRPFKSVHIVKHVVKAPKAVLVVSKQWAPVRPVQTWVEAPVAQLTQQAIKS